MKELMKTRNITIAVIMVLLLLAIGFMTYNRPEYSFAMSSEEMLTRLNEIQSIKLQEARAKVEARDENTVFVDIRKSYDFEVQSIPGAMNMPVAHLLDEDNFALLEEMKENGKTVVLFGDSETESKLPFMLLYELGFNNVRYLCGGLGDFFDESSSYITEGQIYNYESKFKELQIKPEPEVVEKVQEVKAAPQPKKTVPVKPKKVVVEEGC